MTAPPEPGLPRRVVVRSSDLVAPRGDSDSRAFDEHGEYRDVLLRSLMRAQFGLTVTFIALAVGVLISLPLVAGLIPSLADKHLFGLPLTLAVLGVAVYPVLVVIAIVYVRLAERTERHFLDLVEKL
ncbi:MAG TPA: hypothetical protein VIL94_11985 [Acidothermaceae bacterium]|jgi:uncharacterized membrane protein (DUF485 family)